MVLSLLQSNQRFHDSRGRFCQSRYTVTTNNSKNIMEKCLKWILIPDIFSTILQLRASSEHFSHPRSHCIKVLFMISQTTIVIMHQNNSVYCKFYPYTTRLLFVNQYSKVKSHVGRWQRSVQYLRRNRNYVWRWKFQDKTWHTRLVINGEWFPKLYS